MTGDLDAAARRLAVQAEAVALDLETESELNADHAQSRRPGGTPNEAPSMTGGVSVSPSACAPSLFPGGV